MQCFPAHTPLNYLYILTLPILEHIKGGGVEFFYQFTITPVQISDPIIFVLSHTKQNTLRIYYFVFYYDIILCSKQNKKNKVGYFFDVLITYHVNSKKKIKSYQSLVVKQCGYWIRPGNKWPWPMTISLIFTNYLNKRIISNDISFFRLFSCQNLMIHSEIKKN